MHIRALSKLLAYSSTIFLIVLEYVHVWCVCTHEHVYPYDMYVYSSTMVTNLCTPLTTCKEQTTAPLLAS